MFSCRGDEPVSGDIAIVLWTLRAFFFGSWLTGRSLCVKIIAGQWFVKDSIFQVVRQAHVCKQGCLFDDRCHADSGGESSEAKCHFNCVLMVAPLSIFLCTIDCLTSGFLLGVGSSIRFNGHLKKPG